MNITNQEKLQKVLNILSSEAELRDDTYVLKFLDALGDSIKDESDLEQLGLLNFCREAVKADREAVKADNEETENRCNKFIIDLIRVIIKSVPRSVVSLLDMISGESH